MRGKGEGMSPHQSERAEKEQRNRKAENAAQDEWVSEFGWSNPTWWIDDGKRMKKSFLRCAVSSARAVARLWP